MTLCVPNPTFDHETRHSLSLPLSHLVQRAIMTTCHSSGGVTFELWRRFYYPNIRDQLIAKVSESNTYMYMYIQMYIHVYMYIGSLAGCSYIQVLNGCHMCIVTSAMRAVLKAILVYSWKCSPLTFPNYVCHSSSATLRCMLALLGRLMVVHAVCWHC